MCAEMPWAQIGSVAAPRCHPADAVVDHAPAPPRSTSRGCQRVRTTAGASIPVLLVALLACSVAVAVAVAADWRVSGPVRPPDGETVTYVLRGPPERSYDVVVFGGARACPDTDLPGDPAQTQTSNGLLNAGGADVQQFSFSRGRSTICAYNDVGRSVAGKVIRTARGRDRVRITFTRQPNSPGADALVTATGYVGRAGQSPFADAADQHVGTVIVKAIAPPARCPRSPPREHAPHSNLESVGTARFSVDMTITNAFEVARNPLLCAYLTADRRVLSTVRPRVVAHEQVRTASAKGHKTTGDRSADLSDTEKAIARVIAWILVGLLAAGIVLLIRRARRSNASARSTGSVDPSSPASDTPSSDARDSVPAYEFVQRRRDEEVGFAIQRAVGATADVYRTRLRVILEHQDGPDWLDALNRRRASAIVASGRRPPEKYAVFEPRAVINCLAYDPAALQLVGLDAVHAARRLSGLANAAHHPDPDNPLTNADYQRAWRLYTEITGYAAPFDPYAR